MTPRRFHTAEALQAFLMRRKAGTWHLTVEHDEECSPSRCACEPCFLVRPLTVESFLEGQRNEVAWAKRTSS